MLTVKQILIALKIIPGPDAVDTIINAKAEIASVTERNVAKIEGAISSEISVIRYTISEAFERITDLMSTGAVGGSNAEVLTTAQADIFAALERVDAAA